MKNQLRFILQSQLKLKRIHSNNKTSGFTLIELLIGMVMAVLVILPLLAFTVNILDNDRKEQAKTDTDQEVQAALDFISRDLKQAVYIYDGAGLSNNAPNGIKDKLPVVTDAVPVLVFWKRQIVSKIRPIDTTNCSTASAAEKATKCDDAFVYSLVAYYAIKETTCSTTWSCTTQIGRFEIKDGVRDPSNLNNYLAYAPADTGFKLFDLSKANATLDQKMNSWKKDDTVTAATYGGKSPKDNILIDYIDQTTKDQNTAVIPLTGCSTDPRPGSTDPNYSYRQVPTYTGTGAVDAKFQTYSFYACVDVDKNTAQVFLRGNALARVQGKNTPPIYNASRSIFFPSAKGEIKGSGFLSGQ